MSSNVLEIADEEQRDIVPFPTMGRALAQLSDEDRGLFEMLYWADMQDAAAAAELGIAPGTLAVRKHRALERLRASYDEPDVIDPNKAPE